VSQAQIGRELDVRPDLLRKWARQLEERAGRPAGDVFPGNGKQPSAEEEVRRLQRENAVLRQERDFAKKAAAFFARESR
jgi:transposase